MTNKTNRKNKTKQTVTWPASYFTIKQLNKLNSDFVNITLRVRLNNALEEKQVVQLGVLTATKGRPNLVFACSPVDATVIESARAAGITLNESFNSTKITTVSSNIPSQMTGITTTITVPTNTVTA